MGIKEKEYIIEVFSEGRDPEGERAASELSHVSGYEAEEISFSRIYSLRGQLEDEEKVLERISSELLCDSVTQDYSIGLRAVDAPSVRVYLKNGVLDVEGKTLMEALEIMGIEGVSRAAAARRYIMKGGRGDNLAGAAGEFLYNSVIEYAEIEEG